MDKVRAFILKYPIKGSRGDVLVLLPSGDVYIAEGVKPVFAKNGADEPQAPSPSLKREMSPSLSNRLYAVTKLPAIRERCMALYAIISEHPGLRATDYTNLMRDAGHQLKEGVEGRAMIQRHLQTLLHIEAVQSGGLPKQPSYTVS